MQNTDEDMTLGQAAVGTIEPTPRITNGEISEKTLQDLTQRLRRGEFHRPLETWQLLPTKCVDGRPRSDGQQELGPGSAGGSFSLVIADMLTSQRLREYDGQTAENSARYARNVFQYLKDHTYGNQLGDHCDEHAEGEKSGCGAIDKMLPIVSYIAENPETIRTLADALGASVHNEVYELIIARTDQIIRQNNLEFVPGGDVMNELRAIAGEDSVEELAGSHNEVVLSVNTRTGTTLDRAAVRQQFGNAYQAFNVDVWALQTAADIMAEGDKAEAQRQFTAMVYYNIATACVLGGKSLRVVTVQ